MKQLGPVLQFLGDNDGDWGVSALVVTDKADAAPVLGLRLDGGAAVVVGVAAQAAVPGLNCTAWRLDFAVKRTGAPQKASYNVAGSSAEFVVPARGELPSMAYGSCNGFSDPALMTKVKDQNAMWSRLTRLHNLQDRLDDQVFGPHHILLMGGDQIYSDSMWAVVPTLKDWFELSYAQRMAAPFSTSMQTELQTFFSGLYVKRWSQPEVALALASLPTVMMWDDHDIMDGWGSFPQEMHTCAVYQGIFSVAKAAFELFQRQMMGTAVPATLPGQAAYSSGYVIGDMGILVLDMRSERCPSWIEETPTGQVLHAAQVLSDQSWKAAYDWLSAQEKRNTMKHLFVMSSIPVVHPSFELLEKLLGMFPGQQELEDDLRDHWTSKPHSGERKRLIHRLLQASAGGIRVTLLSGDVHVAALGVIESDRADIEPGRGVINQLTASGIVHPAPPGVAMFFLEQACEKVEVIDRGITGTMFEFPTTRHRLIGCRNFLTLQPDHSANHANQRYWANWWAEGEPHPYTKVIHGLRGKPTVLPAAIIPDAPPKP